MASTSAPSVQTPSMLLSVAPETDLSKILYKVVTPYILSAWSQALLSLMRSLWTHTLILFTTYHLVPLSITLSFPIISLQPIFDPSTLQILLMKKSLPAIWMGCLPLNKLNVFIGAISELSLLVWLTNPDLWTLGWSAIFQRMTNLVTLQMIGLTPMIFQHAGSWPPQLLILWVHGILLPLILFPPQCPLVPHAFSARCVHFSPVCVSCMGCRSLWV